MFVMGTNFVGGDLACALSPTDVKDITYVELKNGLYDCLYLTYDVESAPDEKCIEGWDWNTILHAEFEDSTNAGNMDWNLSTVSHLLIKRKKKDEFRWKTIDVIEINSIEDFELIGIDYTNEAKTTYLYSCTPCLYGIEGTYSTVEVESDFDGVFICDKNQIFGTNVTDGFVDIVRNHPNTPTPTVHNKYPTNIKTSVANYNTGSCTGNFIEITDGCELVTNDDRRRTSYQQEIIDFLSNGNVKLLKNLDGRIYLCTIDDQIQYSADTVYNNRTISFNFTEVGDSNSEADLYYAGLSDISSEWWST